MEANKDHKTRTESEAPFLNQLASRVRTHFLYNRLIAAGLSVEEANRFVPEKSQQEILEMHEAALSMKECPLCGTLISPAFLREAYFDFPVFRCQHCNGKVQVVVNDWHYGHDLVELVK